MNTKSLLLLTAAALIALVGSSQALLAQISTDGDAYVSAPSPLDRAVALEQQARWLEEHSSESRSDNFKKDLRKLAKLYLDASELRTATDPQRYANIAHAAGIIHGYDALRAKDLYIKAAKGAEALGNAALAADAYTMGAWIILNAGNGNPQQLERALHYRSRAALLMNSPEFTEVQRVQLARQLGPEPAAQRSRR